MKTLSLFLAAATLQAGTYYVGSSCPVTCTHSLAQLQTAIDAAVADNGGTVYITAGQEATGGVINKPRSITNPKLVTIKSTEANLITSRPTPSNTHVASINGGVTTTCDMTGATAPSWIRFEGIKFTGTPNFFSWLRFFCADPNGSDVSRPAYWMHHYWLVHNVIYQPTTVRVRTAVFVAGAHIHIDGNYIDAAHSSSNGYDPIGGSADESHGIAGANVGGPVYVENNYIVSDGIGSILGGTIPTQRGMGSHDVFFRGNHYVYPWKFVWRRVTADPTGACNVDPDGAGELRQNTVTPSYWQCTGTPGYLTGTWSTITHQQWDDAIYSLGFQKNKMEFKSAQRGQIEGNVIEGGSDTQLLDGQNSTAFLINQVDGCNNGSSCLYDDRWTTVRNLTYEYNLVRNLPEVISEGGLAYQPEPDQTNDGYFARMAVTFRNNLAYNIGPGYLTTTTYGTGLNGRSRLFQMALVGDKGFGLAHVMSHNTFLAGASPEGVSVGLERYDMGRNVITDNIFSYYASGWYQAGPYYTAFYQTWPKASGREFAHNVLPVESCTSALPPVTCPWLNMLYDDGVSNDVPGSGNFFPGYTTTTWYNLATVALDSTTDPTQMTVSLGSPFKKWGAFGSDPGADIAGVTRATMNAVSGAGLPGFLKMHVKSVTPGTGQIIVSYVPPSASACTLKFKKTKDFGSGTTDQADGGATLVMRSVTTTLTAGAWFGQLSCGSDVRDIRDQNNVERFVVQ